MALDELAHLVSRKRGSMGIRAAARAIDISPATLSRIERGHLPDLRTLQKICEWLDEDPSRFLGDGGHKTDDDGVALQIAFKKKSAVSKKTSKSLANLIEKASKQFTSMIEAEGH